MMMMPTTRTCSTSASAAAAAASSSSSSPYVRTHLLNQAPYTPIEPFDVLSAKLGREPKDIVKLDANENPYGPPPEVSEALSKLSFPEIYPDPECRRLRALLAEEAGVPPYNVLVGCGADELIDLLIRVVMEPGKDTLVDCPPTFGMYSFDAEVHGCGVHTLPRTPVDDDGTGLPSFAVDVDAVNALLDDASKNIKMVFLACPNNPDGAMLSDGDLLSVLAAARRNNAVVVLDEAYIEFAGIPTRAPWCLEHDNLCVLRTFSKRAGLAGMRVGYGIFPDNLAEFLWRCKQPYNVSVASETAAVAALSNPEYLEDVKQKLLSEKSRMYELLRDEPFASSLQPHSSAANFILCKVLSPMGGKAIKDQLMTEHGIMVRHYSTKLLDNYIRISVGTPQHTDRLLDGLRAVLSS